MHELSIASSIVDMAWEEADRRGVRVNTVYLELGPLAGVVREALLSAYELAAAGTALEGSRLVVTDVPIVAFCPVCREKRAIRSAQRLCCPECQTPTPEVVQGADLRVTALEVEQ